VTLSGGWRIGGGGGTHTWIFQGTVSANISSQTLSFTSSDTFNNQGTFEARNGGTLLLPAGPTYTNYSGTTLTGGTWQVFGGSITIAGSGIATDAANIILDGAGSTIGALTILASVAAGGSLAIQHGRDFTTLAAISNAGGLVIGSGSTFTASGAYSQTGTLDVEGTLNLNSGGASSGPITDAGNLVIGAGRTFTESGAYSQTGTVFVQTGSTLTLSGSFSNYDGAGTLTGGAYYIAGTFRFNNADITTNAASVVLDGTGAAAIVDQTGADALANFAANAATGTFTIQNSLALVLSGAFTNAGAMVIGTDSALTISGTITQTSGGTTNLSSGATLTSEGGVIISTGSTLAGAGTINANVTNAGQMSIGDSTTAGVLTINGFFLQTASGTLTIKVGGFTTAGTDFDQLVVASGHIDGTLNVALINGYTPATGDSIAVMTFDSVTGTFAELGGDGGLFTAGYDPMDVTLTAN
jgi:hypothetical protein